MRSVTGATASTVSVNFFNSNTSHTKATTATAAALTTIRLAAYYDGTSEFMCLDGTCVSSAASMTFSTGAASVYVGARQAVSGIQANGVVKGICVDSDPTRCR